MLSMLIEEAYVNNVIIEEAKRKNVKGLNKVNNVSKNEIKKRATKKMSKRYMPLEGNNFKAKNPGPAMQPGIPVGQPQSYNLPIPSQRRDVIVRPNPGFIMKDSSPAMQPGVPVGQPQSYNLPIPSQSRDVMVRPNPGFIMKDSGPTIHPGVSVGQPQSYNLPIPAYAGLPATVQNSNKLMPWILGGLGVLGAGGLGAAMLNNDQDQTIDTIQNIIN